MSALLENISVVANSQRSKSASTVRQTLHRVLNAAEGGDVASLIVDICLISLIIASVLAVILESIAAIENQYSEALYWFEVGTIAVFSVEYLLRIWCSVDGCPDGDQKPLLARVRFVFSFHAIVDLVAVLPFYFVAFGIFPGIDMRFLRAVRLLKLTRYFVALNMLIDAIKENSRALGASFMILITIMLLVASGMYYFERHAQPDDFGSIPAAMWFAFSTLTTVGYGDVTPITVGGKVFGAMITVVGIGMVALPTSILASSYSHQLKLRTTRYRDQADQALDDGVLSDTELRDLEALRVDLGLGKHTATQILDAEVARFALQDEVGPQVCPHCNKVLP